MKPAARLGDMHTCPMVEPGPTPHVGGPIAPPCLPTVLVGGQPAARAGDHAICVGPIDTIALGSSTVLVGKRLAARLGDPTVHGGAIVVGCPTVLIGEAGNAGPFPFAITINPNGSIRVGNHIAIWGAAVFQAQVLASLTMMAFTPSADPSRPPAGITTLRSIDGGGHEVEIRRTLGGNATNPASMTDAQDPAIGASSSVDFNADSEPPTAADPSINRPADVGLHHELTHADHASRGQVDLSTSTNPNNPHVEEDNTIARDNLYRDDRAIPRRADHTVL